MRNRKTHSLTFKKKLNKSKSIFRAYNELQLKYGEELELVKEHDRLIYSNDLIKTFEKDNTLKENRPLTEEDIEEMVAKYPYDKGVIY